MKKMFLVLGTMFLMLSLAAMSAFADEKGGAKADGGKSAQEKVANPEKCWQKLPPLDERDITPEYNTVCKAYEEVLNTTCEPPEKVQCNWTLPDGEKRFKKLEWKPLKWKEYRELIRDLRVGGIREDLREGLWTKEEESRIFKLFEEGKRSLSITTVDIDHDGKVEYVVRDDNVPCSGNAGVTFGVMNPETKRMDWKRNKVFFHINAMSDGSEIMLYEGKAFAFKIEDRFYMPVGSDPTKEVMLYEGYSYGSGNVCRFKYLKGGKKQ